MIKGCVQVVPDIEHASNISEKQQIIKLPGVPIYKLQSPTRQDVMHISMAHFHIFQSVVCDVDWNREVLQEPENSKEHFKAMVIEEMKKLGDEGVVAVEAVEGVIEKLKEHPNYQRRRAVSDIDFLSFTLTLSEASFDSLHQTL